MAKKEKSDVQENPEKVLLKGDFFWVGGRKFNTRKKAEIYLKNYLKQ
jgi:hypothetical protein